MVHSFKKFWMFTGEDWQLMTYKEIATYTNLSQARVKSNEFKEKWLVSEDDGKPKEKPTRMYRTRTEDLKERQKVTVSIPITTPNNDPPKPPSPVTTTEQRSIEQEISFDTPQKYTITISIEIKKAQ